MRAKFEALGSRGVDALTPLADDPDERVRLGILLSFRRAADVAGEVPAARAAIVERLADRDFRVREAAAAALAEIGATTAGERD